MPDMTDAAINLTGVTKTYGDRTAVRDLDLTVPRGGIFGFVGPNGSGKTTTIRMILRILLPSSGTVRVLGLDTAPAADDRTGYLPEERGLYRQMKVGEALKFFAKLKGVKRPQEAVDRWLERLEIRDRAGEKIEALSKGLSQKVQFAAAVVHNPELVILDEPFSGLDPVNVESLREMMLELRRGGTTVVLSTHDMSVAERMCDSVMMLHRGDKVLDGTVDEIKAQRGTDTVRVRFAGAPPALEDVSGVANVRDYGREQALSLVAGHEPQRLLAALMERGALTKFEVTRPSLHEIFVDIAGDEEEHHA